MLPKEDQERIDAALIEKGWLKPKKQAYTPGEQQDLLKAALEIMPGSKIVDE